MTDIVEDEYLIEFKLVFDDGEAYLVAMSPDAEELVDQLEREKLDEESF